MNQANKLFGRVRQRGVGINNKIEENGICFRIRSIFDNKPYNLGIDAIGLNGQCRNYKTWCCVHAEATFNPVAPVAAIVVFHGWSIANKGAILLWLWKLDAGEIASIDIGSKSVADPVALKAVVAGLNDTTWLVAEHSCQRSEIPLIIRTTSGPERHWGVARNPCRGGVVINLSPIKRVGVYHGGIFSRNLEEALAAQGIRLPRE